MSNPNHYPTSPSFSPVPTWPRQTLLPYQNRSLNFDDIPRGLFRDITKVITDENQVPPTLCAQAALAIGALVLQDKVVIERPNDGASIPTSMIVIGIAESGERKSGIIKSFMSPVTEYLASQSHAEEWARHDEKMKEWVQTYKRLASRRVNAQADEYIEKGKKDA